MPLDLVFSFNAASSGMCKNCLNIVTTLTLAKGRCLENVSEISVLSMKKMSDLSPEVNKTFVGQIHVNARSSFGGLLQRR